MDPVVGDEYEIEIEAEMSNEWTGPLGTVKMGDYTIALPKAKKGEKHKIKIVSLGTNEWTGQKEAQVQPVS